jgi:branched-chain amino acid transport system permease protein
MLLREYVRLLQGAKYKWMPYYPDGVPVVQGAGFDVYVSEGHAIVALATLAIAAALWWLTTRTDFGRQQRACAQDAKMAALLGVDVDRTIGRTFLLGGAIAGSAGLFAALQYGLVDFFMGYLIGFKALTAALLGGIGSLPGAVLGGLIIALTECYAATLIGSEWKDLAVFAVLIFVLLFRPSGLLGSIHPPRSGEIA